MARLTSPRPLPALILLLAACGGGATAPAGDPSAFTTGLYAVSAPTGRSDACALLPADAALLGRPTTVQVAAGEVSFQAADFSAVPVAAPTVAGPLTGASFAAARSDVFDVAALFPGAPFDCRLRVDRAITGAIGLAGHARATDAVSVRVEGGTQCAEAWAAYQQLRGASGALPCSATVGVELQRTGDLPPPPTYRLDAAQGSDAILTGESNPDPFSGFGALSGFFDGRAFDAIGTSACGYFARDGVYAVAAQDDEYTVQAQFTPGRWTPGAKEIDGTSVVVLVTRRLDGALAFAEAGTVVLHTAPTLVDDPGSVCAFDIPGPLALTVP